MLKFDPPIQKCTKLKPPYKENLAPYKKTFNPPFTKMSKI